MCFVDMVLKRVRGGVYLTNKIFPDTVRLSSSLPTECFPLNNYLSSFFPGINRHRLTLGSF